MVPRIERVQVDDDGYCQALVRSRDQFDGIARPDFTFKRYGENSFRSGRFAGVASGCPAPGGHYGKLDILVNNAGVLLDEADMEGQGGFNTTSSVTPVVHHRTYESNLFVVFSLVVDAPSADSEVPIGRIVNLSSILGSLALHSDPKSPIYGMKGFACDASKTSLNAFTVRLAPELRDTPFKVNSAHPGWVKTDMGDQAAPMEVLGGQDERAPTRPNPACGPTSSSR